MSETLYQKVLNLHDSENVNFELLLDNSKYPIDKIDDSFISIRIFDSDNYEIFIKMSFFDMQKRSSYRISHDRLNLRPMLYSFFKDGQFPLKNLQKLNAGIYNYEFIQADLRSLSLFVIGQIKNQFIEQLK